MVAIKEMSMPKYCNDCEFVIDSMGYCERANEQIPNYDFWSETNEKPDFCPLIEIGTCKDCEHWDKGEERCLRLSSDNGWFEDEYYQVYTESDFYCKYFEKRGNKNG